MTLRLADAILLGDSLKKRDAWQFLSTDCSCGCALGGAYLAAGINSRSEVFRDDLRTQWPWLTAKHVSTIGIMYMSKESIESIADYADSIDPTPRIEPPVQEPSPVEVRQESTVSHD